MVHIGPCESKGGMSTVIQNLIENPPNDWEASCLNTHSDGSILSKLSALIHSLRGLKKLVRKSEIDLAHIHVTHGFSWWRKLRLMKKLERNGIPMVIHIHSGKFEKFCSGIGGKSVRNCLSRGDRKVVLLEDRWKETLADWIPEKSEVVRNFSDPLVIRENDGPSGTIKLLHLSRDSPGKGQEFSIRVLEELISMGIDARLDITGRGKQVEKRSLPISEHGWVSVEEKNRMMSEADFLLSPSEFEGSSMSIIEAIVSGLPAIVSEASSETAGEVVALPLDDPKDWAEKIAHFSGTEEYSNLISENRKISEKYSVKEGRNAWGMIYDSMIVKPR